jgi:hypothetical protein
LAPADGKEGEGLRIWSPPAGGQSGRARRTGTNELEKNGGPANPAWSGSWPGPECKSELVVDFGRGLGDFVEQVNLVLVETSDTASAVVGAIEGRGAFFT